MTEHTRPAPLPALDDEDLATVKPFIEGARHADDTPDLRARIIGDMLARFALDPSPKSGFNVYLETCALHGLAPDNDWPAITCAMSFLARAGLLTCTTFDPATGLVIHNDDTILAGAPVLGVYMAIGAVNTTRQ